MSPSAVLPETTSELTKAGVNHTIEKTAPSLKPAANGTSIQLAELDASMLMFTRNLSPKAVPEPGSPEVWAQATYVALNYPTEPMLTSMVW